MIYKPQLNRLAALALIILIPVGGCIWGSVQYDRTLEKELIKNIEPGKTTRLNILEWFGPPEILARKDGVVLLPPLETGQGKMREVDSKVFFKYFLERHTLSEQHVVYYYFNEWEKIGGVSIPIPGLALASLPLTSGNLQSRELWVLVNRQTEQVEDYVFLEGEEK
ncbi:MAG: hypothetical protein V3T45_00460 [Nitrospinaceae bacterium]